MRSYVLSIGLEHSALVRAAKKYGCTDVGELFDIMFECGFTMHDMTKDPVMRRYVVCHGGKTLIADIPYYKGLDIEEVTQRLEELDDGVPPIRAFQEFERV